MRYLTATLCMVLLLGACRKSERNNDTDITLCEDVANAQTAFNEVFLAVHEACLTTPGIKSYIGCATIATDTMGIPRNMTIDFGASCVSPAGRTRSGKILVYQTGAYAQAGSTSSAHFDRFYINGYNYGGSFFITKLTGNGYKLEASHLVVTAPDSSFTYLLNGSINLDQQQGTTTLPADDDVFDITGSLEITGRKGNTGTYTIDNTTHMGVNGACAQPVSGKLKVDATGQSTRLIDFGSGTCDRSVMITANTQTTEVNIGF